MSFPKISLVFSFKRKCFLHKFLLPNSEKKLQLFCHLHKIQFLCFVHHLYNLCSTRSHANFVFVQVIVQSAVFNTMLSLGIIFKVNDPCCALNVSYRFCNLNIKFLSIYYTVCKESHACYDKPLLSSDLPFFQLLPLQFIFQVLFKECK